MPFSRKFSSISPRFLSDDWGGEWTEGTFSENNTRRVLFRAHGSDRGCATIREFWQSQNFNVIKVWRTALPFSKRWSVAPSPQPNGLKGTRGIDRASGSIRENFPLAENSTFLFVGWRKSIRFSPESNAVGVRSSSVLADLKGHW